MNLNDVNDYVETHIGEFHQKRLIGLGTLKLYKVLRRKNPYLFRAKNVMTAQEIVQSLLDAHLSSQEETIFGDFLEGLAIYICGQVFGGTKSAAEGIDLEFEKENIKYIVSIKSGPNWGNSSQINKMKDNFKKAKRILGTNISRQNIVAVNGCCYGRDNNPDKGEYLKLCGQRFWEFISDKPSLYTEIIEPIGYRAKEKNEAFAKEYAQIINRFTYEFTTEFCTDGNINWDRLIQFNSSQLKRR